MFLDDASRTAAGKRFHTRTADIEKECSYIAFMFLRERYVKVGGSNIGSI